MTKSEGSGVLSERIIMGVDPGTTIMGFGIIKVVGKKSSLICLDILNMTKEKDHFTKLQQIFDKTIELIEEFHPDEMALEAPFFGKNVQSMLKLGRAQGVVMAAGLSRRIPVCEYSPKRIKQSITGNGSASKEMVAGMLQKIYNLKEIPKHLDATDGLAVATCHFFQRGSASVGEDSKSYSSWGSFLKNNPDRMG
ncbi:MAG: crossover junction endodeoxyribonuclease RuvC [Schleiferiaceae bacterium]